MTRLAVVLLLAGTAAAQAAPPADPDWPCVQRMMPALAAGTYWTGPAPAGNWHDDPAVAAVVQQLAPRSLPTDAALAKLNAFTASLPAQGKSDRVGALFAGLVDETNRQRDSVIDRLHSLARRQRDVSGLVATVTTELSHETDPAKREEMTQRRLFLIREFDEAQRTIRYACEVPVQLEARLGSFGRALDAAL